MGGMGWPLTIAALFSLLLRAAAASPPVDLRATRMPTRLFDLSLRLSAMYETQVIGLRLIGPGGFTADVDADGTVHFRDHFVQDLAIGMVAGLGAGSFGPYDPVWQREPVPRDLLGGIRFKLDWTELAMRIYGEDPYRIAKQRLLAATFNERFGMRSDARHRQIVKALDQLEQDLGQLLRDRHLTADEKRRALLARWCEADGTDKWDGEETSGARARRTIAAVLAKSFPAAPLPTDADCRR